VGVVGSVALSFPPPPPHPTIADMTKAAMDSRVKIFA
jgi:hypothetical protein